MRFIRDKGLGLLLCLVIAVPAWFLGKWLPVVGGPVFAILIGLVIAFFPRSEKFQPGITYTGKKILQYAVVLLGFGMNLAEIFAVGGQSLLIIISTISTALIVSFFVSKWLKIPSKTATLVGVGSSICGGSAIAATAPVIDADDEDIAKSISVIFLFNVIAAFLFPALGTWLGFNDIGFGMWAGTAINDTSSVVAAGQTWANIHGNDTALNYATIVKLTRTLAIIPITLVLAIWRSKKEERTAGSNVQFAKIFPWFVLFFLLASVLNTFLGLGEADSAVNTVLSSVFAEANLSAFLITAGKFFITMAMGAIGLNTNLIKLIKSGGKPILLGLICWISIALMSLGIQHILGIW